MSINEFVTEVENDARAAVVEAKAVRYCSMHDVFIRVGDDEAERRAYAIATAALKRDDAMWKREDVMAAIKDELDMAADDECPSCASLMAD